jgi:chromosome partitioning protein
MIITVAGFKGGVGKTTSAVHLATFLNKKGKTLLIDGDPNRSATGWAKRGSLPFTVIDVRQAAMYAGKFPYVVIDTQARPEKEDLEALAQGCDLLVLPTSPDVLALDALNLTINTLKGLGTQKFKILLTIVPPKPSRDGEEARASLMDAGIPVFQQIIRRYAVFQKAALAGVPVSEIKDAYAKQAWNDYCGVGKEILKNEGQEQQICGGVSRAAVNAGR